jgi:glycosyltransferase involved in cell wall biosynthesis
MRRLVFITQHVDPAHPALAATVTKLRALAARVERLVVLADGGVGDVLPENATLRRFAAPWKLGRGARFEVALAAELLQRPIGIVAHMCPIYAVLAAPLARPLGVPVALWYTHWHASPTLRLAARAASAIVTVDARSFPFASSKVRAIGHGIDVDEFACRPPPHSPELRVVTLGRYSPAKGLDVVVRAVRSVIDAGMPIVLTSHGPVLSALEEQHRGDLEVLVRELGLADHVHLRGPIARSHVPELLSANDVLVNNMRAGAPDKAVYEAAAACLPVIASNPVFDALLPGELRFERENPEGLAERLLAFADLTHDERVGLGQALRATVARDHSVERWAERILEVVA